MPYAPPVDIDTFYTDDDLSWYAEHFGRTPWAVHVIGPDDIHTHWNPELPDDDPENFEFTQRTALKWAADHNAWRKQFDADNEGQYQDIVTHCVVLHNGEPWRPDPNAEGTADEYCELFDFDTCEWFCSQCLEVISGTRCPTCAPMQFAGLRRVECDKPDEHPSIFMHGTNLWSDGYGPFCSYCIADHQSEVDAERRHAGHRRWYRRLDSWHLLPVLKRLRLVKSWHWTSGSPALCDGCVSITWRWTR